MPDTLIFAAGPLLIAVGFLVKALTATPDVTRVPRRHQLVTTALPLGDTVLRLRAMVGPGRYRFALEDPSRQVFVLEENVGFFSWGGFYPCFVEAIDGGTQVTVGLQTKAPQWGPVPARQLRKIVETVATAIDGRAVTSR